MHHLMMFYGFSGRLIERAHLIFLLLYAASFITNMMLDMDMIYRSLKLSAPLERLCLR